MIRNKNVLTFKNRLLETMKGLSVSAFAKKCGMSETVIRDYLSGKTYPSLSRLAAIAIKCDVCYNWLATGYKLQDSNIDESSNVYNENIFRIPIYKKQRPTPEEAQKQKFIRDTPPVMNYPIIEGWAANRGLDVHNLILYWAKGNLMHPEINNNNGLIIHTEKNEIIDGSIYLIEFEDLTLLRRIRITIDGWLLLCNDNQCPAIHVLKQDINQYKIIGKVIQIIKDI